MARKQLEPSALSAFCGSMATMIAAGVQLDEATDMLADNREGSRFQDTCSCLYRHISAGDSLAVAMDKSGAFPKYAVDMVSAGERAGHLENVLRNLELYYDEEDRLFMKLRSSVGYPAALLCIMSVILAFTVAFVLPTFTGVYDNMAGSLAVGSFSSVGTALLIGRIALGVMVVAAIATIALVIFASFPNGRFNVMDLLLHLPGTRQALFQLGLSRFTAALATLMSSGIDDQEAMRRAVETIKQRRLRERLQEAAASMADLDKPRTLVQVISDYEILEPLYARMLAVGMRSGNADVALARLSSMFFDDAVMRIDRAFDSIEPLLAALLTIAVGATLVAVMLPLIGIMMSIG